MTTRAEPESEDGWLLDDLLDDPGVVHDAFLDKLIDEAINKTGDPTVGEALDASGTTSTTTLHCQ